MDVKTSEVDAKIVPVNARPLNLYAYRFSNGEQVLGYFFCENPKIRKGNLKFIFCLWGKLMKQFI
jgi:hypothetical protein